jgi:penicillin-binding protein 1A
VGIEAVGIGSHTQVDHTLLHRVLPPGVAGTETEMLETVLSYGTARAAALGQFAAGKTGTTSNYGDAWFVGWNHRYTVAVWVGFPNGLVPMTTEFNGGPVLGGTFPALIWHSFMVGAMQVERERSAEEAAKRAGAHAARSPSGEAHEEATGPAQPATTGTTPSPTSGQEAAGGGGAKGHANPAPATPAAPAGGGEGSEGAHAPAPRSPAPAAPAPASEGPAAGGSGGASNQAPAPAEAPAPKVSGGTGAPTGGASPSG